MKPTYTFDELMKLIELCDTYDDLRLLDSIVQEERKRYSLSQIYRFQKSVGVRIGEIRRSRL